MDSEKERKETECRIKGDKIKVKVREKEVEKVKKFQHVRAENNKIIFNK